MRIVVLGGYGVFGGRLARLLIEAGHDVVVAGRRRDRAAAFCADWGGTPAVMDRDADPRGALEALAPALVVDAAGPFQGAERDGYSLARAAVAVGADCLDLSDDAAFTAGISALDGEARAAGRVVLSGVSTVPALSSAVVDALAGDLAGIERIESAILPGNRAPRGLSVIRAILAQAGRPLAVWRDGEWTEVRGWSGHRRIALPGLSPRPAALIGAPDLALFPERYGARTVLFRAGLELELLHYGLALAALPVRLGLLPSLAPLARPMRVAAALFEPFGSDRGGMSVTVAGHDGAGRPVERTWRMTVPEGKGPFVPALPAALLAERLARGDVAPGARPCLGEFPLLEAEAALARLGAVTERRETA